MVDLTPVGTLQPEIHFPQFVKWLIIKVHKRIDTREGESHTSIRPQEACTSVICKTEHKLNNGYNKLLGAGNNERKLPV